MTASADTGNGWFTGLVDARHARPVAAALVASGAFTADLRMPRDQWFRWKSGILAPCGCNCRRLNTMPAFRRLVDDALADATRCSFPGADYVVAIAHAGIPWAKTLAERLDLPLAYVRAEARPGGGPLVECSPAGGIRAVVVDDVVASGTSTAQAIKALLAETSLRVAGVQSIANWNFPEMRARLARWPVRAVTSYPQILSSAQDAGLISAADAGQLMRFYADPRQHSWGVVGDPPGQALCRLRLSCSTGRGRLRPTGAAPAWRRPPAPCSPGGLRDRLIC
jgi:orotate phosphoribosyltransferase